MAYVAVSGGQEAIEESIRLLHCLRGSTFKELDIEAIEKKLSLLVDRVMSEAGFETGRRQHRRSSFSAACLPLYPEPQLLYPACQRRRYARRAPDLGGF